MLKGPIWSQFDQVHNHVWSMPIVHLVRQGVDHTNQGVSTSTWLWVDIDHALLSASYAWVFKETYMYVIFKSRLDSWTHI